jgi:hypothetical protein
MLAGSNNMKFMYAIIFAVMSAAFIAGAFYIAALDGFLSFSSASIGVLLAAIAAVDIGACQ